MRCYNGSPDSQLQALLDERAAARKNLEKLGLHATYFPFEQKWMVFDSNHKTDYKFHDTIQEAAKANEA